MTAFQDDKGNISFGRYLSLGTFIVGAIVVMAGVVGYFLSKDYTVIIGSGTALIGLAIGGKTVSKFAENGKSVEHSQGA